MRIEPQSRSSYRTDDITGIINHLRQQGYQEQPGRSQYEHARLIYTLSRTRRAVVVVYRNRTVLIQGDGRDHAHAALAALVEAGQEVGA